MTRPMEASGHGENNMAVVPFKRPAAADKAQDSIPVRSMGDPAIRSLISKISKNLIEKGERNVTIYLMHLQTHLDSLQGYVSPANIAQRKSGLAALSDDELRNLLFEGTELQWNERPAFYRALVELIRERKIH